MSRRAARKAARLSGGTVEGLMLPAPPWMINRGVIFGFVWYCGLYSMVSDPSKPMPGSTDHNGLGELASRNSRVQLHGGCLGGVSRSVP